MQRLITLCIVFCLVLVSGTLTLAQTESNPELNAFIAEYVADGEPGVVVYIGSGEGEVLAQGAYGPANLETGDSLTPDDQFRIASASKPLVATVVLQLAESGEIDLDAPIADYVPEALTAIPNVQTATVRQMLQMTSGIFNYTESDVFNDAVFDDPSYMWTAAETLSFIIDEEPYFEPGADYYYSNSNYTLAHVLIENVTGESLADELETRIFAPAGMDNCYLETPDVFAQGIARGYQLDDDDKYIDVTEVNDGTGLGDGGIVCTVADLARFLPALMNGEYLGEDMLAQMLDTVDDGEGGQYGLGIGYDETEYGMMVSHDGASSGFQSSMLYLLDVDGVMVTLTNNLDSEIMEDLVFDLLDFLMMSEGVEESEE